MIGHIIGKYQTLEPVVGTAGAVAKAKTEYSEVLDFTQSEGFNSVLIASTAGSITATVQGSMDGTNFYDMVDSDGNALGQVVAGMTVGTKLINFGSLFSPYIRFKVVEGDVAATVVTLTALLKRKVI